MANAQSVTSVANRPLTRPCPVKASIDTAAPGTKDGVGGISATNLVEQRPCGLRRLDGTVTGDERGAVDGHDPPICARRVRGTGRGQRDPLHGTVDSVRAKSASPRSDFLRTAR